MKRWKYQLLFILILLKLGVPLQAQIVKTDTRSHYETDFEQQDFNVDWVGWKSVVIPFEFTNNLIIINVELNQKFPLKFIFDTGAKHSIITQKAFADAVGLSYTREFKIMGADMKTELTAYLAQNASLKVGRMIIPNKPILVLAEDYFRYDQLTGVSIHGLLGADFFRHYTVEINYNTKEITLTKPEYFKRNMEKYEAVPIEIEKGKPYLRAKVNITGDSIRTLKFLIDTGAGLPLLIYTNTDTTMTIPQNAIPGNIGRGLGGYLYGYKGRIQNFSFSSFKFEEVVTNFQVSDSLLLDSTVLKDRNGIVGNEILSRFNIVLDYWNEKVYLIPNKSYLTKFKFDRSGLALIASGKNFSRYTVQYVVPNSPADEANIQKGDIILKVNGLSTQFFTMTGIIKKLQKRQGKKIKLVITRNGNRQKVTFRLRDIL